MQAINNWYAVYTRPKGERKVAEALSRKKIENYCPLNTIVPKWPDKKRITYEPLFPSYVFVRTSESQFKAIKQTDGVLSLVHWLGKPALINKEEIAAIRHFVNTHHNIVLEKIFVNTTDKVKVISSPLLFSEGPTGDTSGVIRVLLPSLGYALTAAAIESDRAILSPLRIRKNTTNQYDYAIIG